MIARTQKHFVLFRERGGDIMAEGKKYTEDQLTGAHYIIQFYNQVMQINHQYALYLNLMTELEYKYGKDEGLKRMNDGEKETLASIVQMIRYHSHQIYLQYYAIKDLLKEAGRINLQEKYLKIKNDFIIDRNNLEEFTIVINKIVVNEVMRGLLQNSQDIINSIYQPS